jgi:hypothetical protein
MLHIISGKQPSTGYNFGPGFLPYFGWWYHAKYASVTATMSMEVETLGDSHWRNCWVEMKFPIFKLFRVASQNCQGNTGACVHLLRKPVKSHKLNLVRNGAEISMLSFKLRLQQL